MTNEELLSYGLGASVKYSMQDGDPFLTLSYPLKVIRLHPLWAPVFTELSQSRFLSFGAILSLVHPASAFDVESFLNTLVRKGFLIQWFSEAPRNPYGLHNNSRTKPIGRTTQLPGIAASPCVPGPET